jgi:hypothetical protein
MIRSDPALPNEPEADANSSVNSEFSDLMAELKSYQTKASVVARVTTRYQALEISIDDWDILFRAVQARLRSCVGAGPDSTATLQARDGVSRVQAIVLDCVRELEKLHEALNQERRE